MNLLSISQNIVGEYYTNVTVGTYFALALSFVSDSQELLVMLYGIDTTGAVTPFTTYELLFWSIANSTLLQTVSITTGISCVRRCSLKATQSLVVIEYGGGYTAYQMSGLTCIPAVFLSETYAATNLISATNIVKNVDIFQSTLLVAEQNQINAYGLTYDPVARAYQIAFFTSLPYPSPLSARANLAHDIHIFSQDTYVVLKAGYDANFYLVRFSCTSCFTTGIGSSIVTVDQILDSAFANSVQLLRFPIFKSNTGGKNSWAFGEGLSVNCKESFCKNSSLLGGSSRVLFLSDPFVKTSQSILFLYKPTINIIVSVFSNSFGSFSFLNYSLDSKVSALAVSDTGLKLAVYDQLVSSPVKLFWLNYACGPQTHMINHTCYCNVYDQFGLHCEYSSIANPSVTSVPFYIFIIAAILLVVLIVSAVCLYRYCRKPATHRKPWVYNAVDIIRCDV